MTAQASLFGNMENPGGGHSPAPRPPKTKPRRNTEQVREPVVPFGDTDRSGRYWYQRFLSDLNELPEGPRQAVATLILDTPGKQLQAARCLLDRYCRANPGMQDNVHEAVGE